MLKKILLFALAICFPLLLSAQLTYGTTGLLHAPSAEMQRDKTVMIGGNFLNKEITPPTWYYHTYNYFCLHLYPLQGGSAGLETLRLLRFH